MKIVATTFADGFFWNNFKSMEQDFLRFMEYVPHCVMNEDVYSPKLTGLLLQIGGYIDSAFKEMASFFSFSEVKSYKMKEGVLTEKVEAKAVKDILDYCAIFESIYNLSENNRGDLIAKLDFGLKELRPFEKFADMEPPEWWTAYNKVKHEYSAEFEEANINSVLNGLAGAFLLNAVHYPSIELLWKLGYLQAGVRVERMGFQNIVHTQELLQRYTEPATTNLTPINIAIRTETPLFLYIRQ